MGVITGYPDDTATTDSDKFLTSDASGSTKLTPASTLKSYVLTTGNITAPMLATNAIKLASSSITSNQTVTTIGSNVPMTSFSATVTVPAGGRDVSIYVYTPQLTVTGPTILTFRLWSGSVGGTQLQAQYIKMQDSGDQKPLAMYFQHTPSAGSITYLVSVNTSTNNVTLNQSSTQPGQLIVSVV